MRNLGWLLVLALLSTATSASANGGLVLERPVPGPVVQGFASGHLRYGPGHRGVDLAATPGEQVRAAEQGVVHFAGMVAGRGSVSIDHGGGLRTTYTPVIPSVTKGQRLGQGHVLGTLGVGHCPQGCLHWGLTDSTAYFDPTAYLAQRPIRLWPYGHEPRPAEHLPAARVGGQLPVAGSVSSPFGMRRHPITGVWKLHDGTDLAAACGTGVHSPWAGTLSSVSFDGAYGWRVILDHPWGRSAYAHLQRPSLGSGQQISAGQQIGRVGSTGLSTGCHLHWMAWRGQSLVDPLAQLGR